MNARSGAEGAPKGQVRKRLARLIEPAVPRQPRRTGHHDDLNGPGLVHGPGHSRAEGALHEPVLHEASPYEDSPLEALSCEAPFHDAAARAGAASPGARAVPPGASGAVAPTGVLEGGHGEPSAAGQEETAGAVAAPEAGVLASPGRGSDGPAGAGGTVASPAACQAGELTVLGDDPLEHPSAQRAADAAALENLLRCWVRETGLARPEDGVLRVPLAATGATLIVPVRHWSSVGCHRFDPPSLDRAPEDAPPLEAVALAALIGREAAHGARRAPEPESAALVGRVADSLQRTALFLSERRANPEQPGDIGPFLDGEQALLFGHPLHPTPKSREGLSEAEARVFSPELRGGFPLHWMAVDRSVLAGDSAWTDRGKPVSAAQLAHRMAEPALGGRLPEGCVPLPLHPWQARELSHSPDVVALLDAGLLHDLGQAGERWYPTSSVRTVFRPDAAAMLKLSLGLRITNSRRENLRKELLRGVEIHRLLRGSLGAAWRIAHPGFDIVRDPAWLGVDLPGQGRVHGFDTVIRHNPFGPSDDAVCVAGLTAPVPDPAGAPTVLRSRLARVVASLAARTGRPLAAVATEWFLRYLDAVVRPVLWLDAHAGIALEAHQQNTLVLLDAQGWPEGGRYRDNQGYYFRTSRREELDKRLPRARLGVASDTFVADEVTDERFAYYLGINNVFGLIGAFGAQRLADEQLLIAAFRRFLEGAARGREDEPVSPLPALLLESATLRCKANLLTRLHGMDELVGPVDTQSVYVTLDNPLAL